ncbi:MAG: hypothetical protein K0U41_05005 [Gammaproteobacteria bacterium]|nr:hypothetical protein [Gammaproteobacteria bacterium]
MMVLAGYGFVGKAYGWFFERKFKLKIVDPKYNDNKITSDTTSLICCVPTPESPDGSCNMEHVFEVVKNTPQTAPIIIKSTISLEGWNALSSEFPEHRICFSPEFLRADNAMEDIQTMKSIILSGDSDFWLDKVKSIDPQITAITLTPEEAITVKYFRNSYLATKLSFFNELFDFCKTINIDFDRVREGISIDPRIGDSHTFVSDANRGWAGLCFPKDTKALLKMAENHNTKLSTLEAAVKSNDKIIKDSSS